MVAMTNVAESASADADFADLDGADQSEVDPLTREAEEDSAAAMANLVNFIVVDGNGR